MSTPLSDAQIQDALKSLPGWRYEEGKLKRRFQFGGFKEAVSFIVRLAFEAERLNHHPELRNIYNRVEIALSTHDAGGRVTARDVELAKAIESFNWLPA
ncbi:MAG TPA: 4a-hydroxytetrahydrobiopterin dehydratase [Phycisphaeraceae bacterium]